jgi:hypothetical protein
MAVLLLFSAVFLAVRDTADARATPLQNGEADALWTVNDDHTWFKSHLKNWSKSDDNTTTDDATNATIDDATNATTDDATGTWSKGDDADDDADDDAAAWGQNADDVTAPTDDVPFAANGSQPTNAFAPFEKRIDLREYAAVQEFLKSKGVSDDSDEAAILQWVPSALVVRMWPDRVAGAVGGDALGGFVAFSIIQPAKDTDDSYTAACYLIVMSLTGDVQSVKVFSNGTEAYGAPRIDGMKLMDPDHLILSFNTDPSFELGRAYSYDPTRHDAWRPTVQSGGWSRPRAHDGYSLQRRDAANSCLHATLSSRPLGLSTPPPGTSGGRACSRRSSTARSATRTMSSGSRPTPSSATSPASGGRPTAAASCTTRRPARCSSATTSTVCSTTSTTRRRARGARASR